MQTYALLQYLAPTFAKQHCWFLEIKKRKEQKIQLYRILIKKKVV